MVSRDRHRARRQRVIRRFGPEQIDALLVTSPLNVRYLSGFRGDDSALLVTRDEAYLLTDSRYAEEVVGATQGLTLVVRKKGLMHAAGRPARRSGVGCLGVESAAMTLHEADDLARSARGVEIRHTRGLVERFRALKDAEEIAAIRAAVGIAEQAFRLTLARIGPGWTERQAALLLDRTMQDLGAEAPAFPTIVASGPRTSMPHAVPTERRIRKAEPVLFDWGARRLGYHSDLTRMAVWDRIPPAFERIYKLVWAAQRRAVAQVRPGRSAGKIDMRARATLKAHRHGKHFGHGLGHGVGLAVHEAPIIGPAQQAVLRPGMVFSVEPGIYLPGRGGVRIEDLVLVTRKGHAVLTSLPGSLKSCLIRA